MRTHQAGSVMSALSCCSNSKTAILSSCLLPVKAQQFKRSALLLPQYLKHNHAISSFSSSSTSFNRFNNQSYFQQLSPSSSSFLPSFQYLATQKRFLNLHEYQSKQILRSKGLNVQRGDVCSTVDEAYKVAKSLKDTGAKELIIKCQVQAGGRGKGRLTSGLKGGVKICSTPEEVRDYAKQMLGFNLITHQTTQEGEKVDKVLVLESVDIKKELYLSFVLDPTSGGVVLIVSKQGGMDIEEVSEKSPEAVVKIPLQSSSSIRREECLLAAEALGLSDGSQSYPLNVVDQITRLFDLFVSTDLTMVEINPLAVTSKCDDHLMCVDAKLNFDDNAAFRQRDITAMEDRSLLDPQERQANDAGLSFVAMKGNIGCLVNGAGLAMATMDIVKLHGGEPANFLDVGGGADVSQVTEAIRIVKSDANVRVMFINIFGGIMRCDIVANGLVAAVKATQLNMPLVVRLVGNRVSDGKRILENSGVNVLFIDDLEEAAKKVCQLAAI